MKQEIIYIMSDSRSGSTLLENILSKSPEIISLGELHNLHSHLVKGPMGTITNWKCSCGIQVDQCDFWNHVLKGIDNSKLVSTYIIPKNRKAEYIFSNYKKSNENFELVRYIDRIYEAVFKKETVSFIIDSSKHPTQALALYENSKFNFKIIYLKRDLRAVSLSKWKWTNKKENLKKTNLIRVLLRSILWRLKLRIAVKKFKNSDILTLYYKDLAKNPKQSISNIRKYISLKEFDIPKHRYLDNDHTIGGSPSRFKKTPIKYDDSWIDKAKNRPFFNTLGAFFNRL